MRYVIIGGGIAGTTAAEELRKRDANADITLLSEEQHPVYSRVLVPHYLKAKIPRERVFLKKDSWYAEQNIEWMPGVRAEAIDVRNKFVTTSEARELPYDKLLVASGGEIRTLPFDRRGVSYLRTVDDADHLLQLVSELGPEAKTAVFGGGFIACEYINFFAHRGMPTEVAIRGERFWQNILDAESGALINDRLAAGGVKLHQNAPLNEQTFADAAVLGVGIGIEPDFSMVKAAGIECQSGIRTNEFLETNVPDVYAAGDVAEFHDMIVKRHMHVGNWMNAQMQGRCVAANMAGERTVFKLVSSYATNVLGLEAIFVGDTKQSEIDEVKVVGSRAEGGVTQLFGRGGAVVGGTMIGRNADRAKVTKAIQEQRPISEVFA